MCVHLYNVMSACASARLYVSVRTHLSMSVFVLFVRGCVSRMATSVCRHLWQSVSLYGPPVCAGICGSLCHCMGHQCVPAFVAVCVTVWATSVYRHLCQSVSLYGPPVCAGICGSLCHCMGHQCVPAFVSVCVTVWARGSCLLMES